MDEDKAEFTVGFLDTSVLIGRLIHSPAIREQIKARIGEFDFTATSLVVRLEFKRRLLKDAAYLLSLFQRYKSFAEVQRHVVDILTPYQKRKQRISLQLLTTLFEDEDDGELRDRSILLLTGLLRDGLYELDNLVDHMCKESACSCGIQDVRKKGKVYDFGPSDCSKSTECGIAKFLESHADTLQIVLAHLESQGNEQLSDELKRSIEFIRSYLGAPSEIRNTNPCSQVGDLLIALESKVAPVMFTMNGKESQHLCRALGQSMIVRPSNAEHEDIECGSEDVNWPSF